MSNTSTDARLDVIGQASKHILGVGGGTAPMRTGIVVEQNTVVSPARHAEEGEEVPGIDAAGGEYRLRVTAFDSGLHTAVLSVVSGDGVEPVRVAENAPHIGQEVFSLALPSGDGLEFQGSAVRCVGGETRLPDGRLLRSYYQTDAPLPRGFAGAALFSFEGDFLGRHVGGRMPWDGFIVPGNELVELYKSVQRGEQASTAYLGVRTVPTELEESRLANLEPRRTSSEAVVVVGVEKESPAAGAGILSGDVILDVDSKEIAEQGDLIQVLLDHDVQRPVTVAVLRGAQRMEFTVKMTSRTPGHRRRRGGPWRHHPHSR